MTFTPRSSSLGPNILRCLFAAIWLSAVCAFGANIYVSHPGAGTQDGSSAGNAHSLVWLNAWSGINPGDTVHLVGTFTNGIVIAGPIVGDYGNPVTLYFEPNANFTAPAWGQNSQPSGQINTANSYSNTSAIFISYCRGLIIDGGSNGLIQATANATGWLQWSNRCDGISINSDPGSFEIKNLTISNLCQRTVGQDDAYTPGHTGDLGYIISGQAIIVSGGFTNSSIHNCNITGTANLVNLSYSDNTDSVLIYSNNLSHCSFGVNIVGNGLASGTRWQGFNNVINCGNDWSGNNNFAHGDAWIMYQTPTASTFYAPSTNVYSGTYYVTNNSTNIVTLGGYVVTNLPQYGEYGSYYFYAPGGTNDYGVSTLFSNPHIGITNRLDTWTGGVSFWAATNYVVMLGTSNSVVGALLNQLQGATNTGMQIYRNYFGPTWGTNASAWVGVYINMPSGFQNYWIYDNLMVVDNINFVSSMANSVLAQSGGGVINNTLIQASASPIGTGVAAGYGGGYCFNNICSNFVNAVYFNPTSVDQRGWGWFTAIDYNCYIGITEWFNGQGAWPSLFYHPAANPPFYDANVAVYSQGTGYETHSVTNYSITLGTNLTAFALQNGIPQLTNDFNGNPRPTIGAWTIGAIQGVITNPPPSAPAIASQPGSANNITNTTLTASLTFSGSDPVWITCYLTNSGGLTPLQAGVAASSFTSNSPTAKTNLMVFVLTNLQGSATSSICSQGWTNGLTGFFNLTVDGNLSIHAPGDVVSITCTNSSTFNGWTSTAGTIANSAICGTTFTMPAGPAIVTSLYTNQIFQLTVDGHISFHTNSEFVSITCTNSGRFFGWLYFSGSLINLGCGSFYIMPGQSSQIISLYTNLPPTTGYRAFFHL